MTILGLAWRSLKQRRLASILTAVSIALGVALTIAVVALRDGAESSYRDTARGYDCILGPTHGSTLDIVLNTMFHVGDMGGTIPWDSYEEAKVDEMVKYAVPYAVGDMLRGHHVVGTTSDMFRALMDPDNVPLMESIRGRVFKDGKDFEAVIGGLCGDHECLVGLQELVLCLHGRDRRDQQQGPTQQSFVHCSIHAR